MIAFTEWASTVLKINTELPARGYWSYKTKDLEKELSNDDIYYGRPNKS
jgi:hypothetical protein